jgi:signal transduction histidine kinase
MATPLSLPLLPLALLAAGVVAALLASQPLVGGWLAGLAMLLTAAGALASGIAWSRQRQLTRLRDARLQHQMLGQLIDVWQWQTDAEHRLVRFQPPQRAPSSSWVEGAFSGAALWERFDDATHSLQPRLLAQSPLTDLRVEQTSGGVRRQWRLRGLPRFDDRGRFAGYVGVAEPTEPADALAAAQQALDGLLQHAPMALCLASPAGDAAGLVLRRANAAACTLLRLNGEPDGRLPWPQALAALPDGLRQCVQALQPGQATQHDGQTAWLCRIGLPGTPSDALLLAIGHDGADDSEATRALAAEHASFSYTISHDLRAPIRVVEGFGRILKEDYGHALDRIGNDHLDRVMGAAARMNHMIDALLSLSKLSTQPLARRPVDLSQLAGWVIDDLRRGQPERQVTVTVAPGLSANGDPTLLRLVLENLLGNAWKYSAKVAQATITFDTTDQAGGPAFVVCDNGAGFDMRFADRLFGVFQRLHSSSDFAGTGVGLASVRRIVRRHGGDIWAESAVGDGARFYFTLKG